MVGVPGKSKGCATCRRRKVKCDLTQPHCDRCLKSNIACEGYARFPVFINRTASGLQKRSALEEAKPSTAQCDPKRSRVSTKTILPQEIHSPAIEATRFTSWFREAFARSPPSKFALQSPSYWLDKVMGLNAPQPALQTALLAVSLARCGKVHQNEPMLRHSRGLYTQSLGRLKVALSDTDLAFDDDILATTTLMVLYELFDSSSTLGEGWSLHIEGQLRLMQHRGPNRHQKVIPRAILEHARYIIMMRSLMQRKACILGEEAWLMEPWRRCDKSIEQRVFDDGLRLAGIFEQSDTLLGAQNYIESLTSILNACVGVDERVGELRRVCKEVEQPFQNPASMLLNITAMAIQLGACVTGSKALQWAITSLARSPTVPERQLNSLSAAMKAAFPLRRRRTLYAVALVNAVAGCLAIRTGAMGAARMLFPLKLAREQLQASDPEFIASSAFESELIRQSNAFGAVINPGESNMREMLRRKEAAEGRLMVVPT